MMKKIFFFFPCAVLWSVCLFSQVSLDKKSENAQIIEYLEFREVDIKDILRQLTKQYDLNIIFSESVKGLITVQLTNVTIDEALDAIVTINGFVYTKKGRVIKVTTPEEAEKEGKQTKVFRLNNADATSLKDSLSKVLSTEGTIEVDTRSNSLIVTDIPRVINEIEQMIKEDLDSSTPQVLIEARFIEVTVGTTEKLGIDWSPATATGPLAKVTGSTRPTTVPFKSLGGEEEQYKDLFPPAEPTTVGSGGTYPNTYGFPYADSGDFSLGSLDFSQLQMALNFIKSHSDARIISSPRIVTTDNHKARIQVGETRRIRSEETVDADTNDTTYSYDKEDVGIILEVTPKVTPDGYVQLKLTPEVSSADRVDVNNINIVEKRIADTEVIIKDGQTIVIGGLIETRKTEVIKKVPFLGDIPGIGRMFTHTTIDPNQQKELLIFVTARIVKQNEAGLLAYKSGIVTSPPRPLKLDVREIKLDVKKK